jgi:signal transduction histidine kinase
LLNRKLNRPIRSLMDQMTAFAGNRPIPAASYLAKDEIGELIGHFGKMRSQIERARTEIAEQQREKEYLVAALSHDLKTPLTSIRAYGEALCHDGNLTEKEKGDYFNILFDKIGHMGKVLDDLTMYTSLRSSGQNAELVEVDGEEFFEMLLAGYDELCKRNGIRLVAGTCVNGTCKVHAQQMIRLVDNLMGNAIRYTKPDDAIWLAAFSEDQDLPDWVFPPFADELASWRGSGMVLLVQNQGEAIPEEEQERIFAPFYQADAARASRSGGSSGLGLSIVRMIVQNHQGDIRLWSAASYGTLIACRFPSIHEGEKSCCK